MLLVSCWHLFLNYWSGLKFVIFLVTFWDIKIENKCCSYQKSVKWFCISSDTSLVMSHVLYICSGKDRNLNIVELLCAICFRWYHESCIGYQLGKLVPFMMNYFFVCKNCSPTGLESFKKNQAREYKYFGVSI